MAFMDIFRGIGDLIMNNKLITFLSVALFAFVIATFALAGENNSNADALSACQDKLWHSSTTAAPATTTTVAAGDTTLTPEETTSATPEATSTTLVPPEPENSAKFLVNFDNGEQVRRR